MKEIEIKNHTVLIDDEDEEFVLSHTWYPMATKDGRAYYHRFRNKEERGNGKKWIALHRELINAPDGLEVDHKDRNPLNNQKSNLRLATSSQNSANSKSRCRQYKGVWKGPKSKGWTAYIKMDGKPTCIGTYKTEVEAAYAYDNAARKIYGEFAYLNFPDDIRSPVSYRDSISHSKGITFHKRNKRWEARIFLNKKYIYLGSFHSEKEAMEAREQAERKKIKLLEGLK